MRWARPLLLAVAVGAVVGGCAGGNDDVQVLGSQEGRGAVSGVVRRAGVVVTGAQVSLAGQSVVTDASGAYRIDGVAPGRYRLEVRDPGDDSVSCTPPSGACISGRSAVQVAVSVVVPPEGGDVLVDVDL